jgi:hypothetical protein
MTQTSNVGCSRKYKGLKKLKSNQLIVDMLNVKEFKKTVGSTIWSRGKNYFEDGAVTDLQDNGDGNWNATVSGNDDYEVTVDIKFDHIQEWDCDCPYDGDICKHVVATVLAIEEEQMKVPAIAQEKGKSSTNSAKMSFPQLVDSVQIEELRQFIKSYANESSGFKRMFQVYFAEKNPTGGKESYTKLIAQSLNSGVGRYGFIDYYHAPKAFKIVFSLIDKANEFLNHKNYFDPLQIALAVIDQVSEVAGNMDDSDGMVVDSFDGAFDLISSLIENKDVPMPLKDQMLDLLKTEYAKPKYEHYGDDMILDSITDLAELTGRMNELFPVLDLKIKSTQSDYELTSFLQKKLQLLKASGRIVEMVQLINENLTMPEFRQMKIDEFLEQKRWEEAIQTIKEGIKISEKLMHRGTTMNWKNVLLKIYSDTHQQQKYLSLLRELFYDSRFEKKYYLLLKSTIDPEKWPIERDSIISMLRKERVFDEFLYELYVMEEMWDELMGLMKQRFRYSLLRHYHEFLFPRFPADMLKMYSVSCQKFAEESNNRSNYKELASMLKQVQKIEGGKPIVTMLLSHFRDTYKRRPAMMEELAKIT